MESEVLADKVAKMNLAAAKILEHLRSLPSTTTSSSSSTRTTTTSVGRHGGSGQDDDEVPGCDDGTRRGGGGGEEEEEKDDIQETLCMIRRALAEHDAKKKTNQQHVDEPPPSTSTSSSSSSFFDGIMLSGHSNYTYKLWVKDDYGHTDDDEHPPPSSSRTSSSPPPPSLAVFVKIALRHALWNPGAEQDLNRLTNEMKMMSHFTHVCQQINHHLGGGNRIGVDHDGRHDDDDHDGRHDDDHHDDGRGKGGGGQGIDFDFDFGKCIPVCHPYFILDLSDDARCLVNHFQQGKHTWHHQFIEGQVNVALLPKVAQFMAVINLQLVVAVPAVAAAAAADDDDDDDEGVVKPTLSSSSSSGHCKDGTSSLAPFHPDFNAGIHGSFLKLRPIFKALFGRHIADDPDHHHESEEDEEAVHENGGEATTTKTTTATTTKTKKSCLHTTNDMTHRTPYNRHYIDYARHEVGQTTFDRIIDRMMDYYDRSEVVLHGDYHVVNILVEEEEEQETTPSTSPPPSTVFHLCDWDLSHVGERGRDVGGIHGFPVACAYFLAAQGRVEDAYRILDHLAVIWEEYARILRTVGEKDDDYLASVYRSGIGWMGMYSLGANVLLHLQMDNFPFDRVSERMGATVMSSYALTGLKAVARGFLNDDDDNANDTATPETLESVRKWFHDTVSEQIEFLASKADDENRSA